MLQGADGVCRLLGTCEKTNKLCLVMKRYERSLADLIKAGPLAAATMRSISHTLCRTLEQLHRAGVVVQDIKPQNILLDLQNSPFLADFGIATLVRRTTQIMPTSLKGTSNYMAPEAFVPPFGVEVDIWSMGCVILEMSTGNPPWAEFNMQQIMMAVAMLKKAPDVPDSVPAAETVRKCFAFGPKERPTASELADAFLPQAVEVPGKGLPTLQVLAAEKASLAAELAAHKEAAEAASHEAASRLAESEALVAELAAQLEAMQAEKAELAAQLAAQQLSVAALTEVLQEQEKETKAIRNDVAECQANRDSKVRLEMELRSAKEKIVELEKVLQDSEECIGFLEMSVETAATAAALKEELHEVEVIDMASPVESSPFCRTNLEVIQAPICSVPAFLACGLEHACCVCTEILTHAFVYQHACLCVIGSIRCLACSRCQKSPVKRRRRTTCRTRKSSRPASQTEKVVGA
jgi:hypothetical protein